MSDPSIAAATSDLLRLAVEVEEQAHPLQQALQSILQATGCRVGLLAELPSSQDRTTRLQPIAALRLDPDAGSVQKGAPLVHAPDRLSLDLALLDMDDGAVIEVPLEGPRAPGQAPEPPGAEPSLLSYVFGRESTGHYLLALDRHLGSVGLADHDGAHLLFQALEALLHGWKLSSLRASAEELLEQTLANDTEADAGVHHLCDHLQQGVIQIDVHGYIEYISRPALRLLGLDHLDLSERIHFSALLSSAGHLLTLPGSGLPDHLRWIFEQRTLPSVDSIPDRFVFQREHGSDLSIEKVPHQEGFHGLIISPCPTAGEGTANPEKLRHFDEIISNHVRLAIESRQESDELLAAVARNFLDPIRHLHQQATRLLTPDDFSAPGRAEALHKIAHTAAHLSDLVSDVVDYHLVARSTVRCEAVDLDSLIRLTTQSIFPDLAAGTLLIEKLPTVRADPNLLIRALSHLISFAHDHRKLDEPLRLNLAFSEAQQTFVLSDNGAGMDMGHITQLVNVSLAEAPPLDGDAEHHSRALAVAKKIFHMHGGAFEAISIPGVGTTFYFQLPLATTKETTL